MVFPRRGKFFHEGFGQYFFSRGYPKARPKAEGRVGLGELRLDAAP